MKKWLVVLLIVLLVAAVVFFFVRKKPGQDQVTWQIFKRDKPVPVRFIPDTLSICSFNIQFLGYSTKRDNNALAELLKNYDIVVVQELVAPPYDGLFPDGSPCTGDPEAALFFEAMCRHGFAYLLSEEDTGTGDRTHLNSSATEWFVAFYKPPVVGAATDLSSGFLAGDRANNPDFERVPYAFSFRSANNSLDFVLISVHLQPDDSPAARARRIHELFSINNWINSHNGVEKDFIILGDMNLYSAAELAAATPAGFLALNDECRATNSLSVTGKGEPYDQVLYNPVATAEVDKTFDLVVVNLVEAMRPYWTSSAPYPGDPYNHNSFRQYYSDHFPVVFRLITPRWDDDGAHM